MAVDAEVRAAILHDLQTPSLALIASAIERLGQLGPDADALLSEALLHERLTLPMMVAYALGEVRGPYGRRALEAVLTSRPKDVDLRSAAIYALGERAGADATQFLTRFLGGRSRSDAYAAAATLAHYGDDSVWSQVFDELQRVLRNRRTGGNLNEHPPTYAQVLLTYLGRFAADSVERRGSVGTCVVGRWSRLTTDEQGWLDHVWPGLASGLPAAPDLPQLRLWLNRNMARVRFSQ